MAFTKFVVQFFRLNFSFNIQPKHCSSEEMYFFIDLGGGFVFCVVLNIIKHGWWSENLLVSIPAVLSRTDLLSLQKKLSIKVPVILVNLVGKVIRG